MRSAVLVLAWLAIGGSAAASPRGESAAAAAAVAEASLSFRLPQDLIRRVIGAESAWNSQAVSRAGALGLMQLMPSTWTELRARLALGPDPFDEHDNIVAGAAYLREMLDRFGAPGFLAAYNAGPGRYADALGGRAHLPTETVSYVALLTRGGRVSKAVSSAQVRGWRRSDLRPSSSALFPAQGEEAR